MIAALKIWFDSRLAHGVARGLALFVGALAGLGVFAKLRTRDFEAYLWWVDLRLLPDWLADTLVAALALSLLAWSVRRHCESPWRIALLALLALFTLAMLGNASVFWWLQAHGRIHAAFPLPLSLLFAAGLLFVGWHVRRNSPSAHRLAQALACGLCVLIFPLLQVVGFGKTDYRRPAQAAVVFGARAYADGRPSDALADRVRTACQLYQQGLVRRLIFSGGPGDGPVHETESMRRMALRLGVPDAAITRDEGGLNTAATVRNTRSMLTSQSTIAVSEFYHVPRIKLAFQRAGLDVRTVPAQPAHWARAWPLKSMAREVPAFWLYYARAALGVS